MIKRLLILGLMMVQGRVYGAQDVVVKASAETASQASQIVGETASQAYQTVQNSVIKSGLLSPEGFNEAAYYCAYALPIWYVLREAMKTYHATTCHPDRFHMIPGIADAKEVKIIVIINNVSITIEKENQKYKTKNSQDLSNTPFDVLKKILNHNNNNIKVNSINTINIKVKVNGKTYSLTGGGPQTVSLRQLAPESGLNPNQYYVENLLNTYLTDKFNLTPHITVSNGYQLKEYSMTIYQEQSYINVLRKLGVASVYMGLLYNSYYKTALTLLGTSWATHKYFKDNKKRMKKLVTLTASSIENLEKEFSRWVDANVSQDSDYDVILTEKFARDGHLYTSSINNGDNKAFTININPNDDRQALEQKSKEERQQQQQTQQQATTGNNSNDPYNQTTDIQELFQVAYTAGKWFATTAINISNQTRESAVNFVSYNPQSNRSLIARHIFENKFKQKFTQRSQL